MGALALPAEDKAGVEDPREMERLAEGVADVAHTRFIVSTDADEHVEKVALRGVGLHAPDLPFPRQGPGAAMRLYGELILPRLRARFG